MMQLIQFELKKYVMRKHNLYVLLLFSALFGVVIFLLEMGYVLERDSHQAFFEEWGTNFDNATEASMKQAKEELFDKLYQLDSEGNLAANMAEMKKKGKYGDTQVADYDLFVSALDCIEVVRNRNENLDIILNSTDNGISSEYVIEKNTCIADRKKLNAIVKTALWGWPVCIFLIFIFGFSYSMEYEKHTHTMLSITCRGEGALYVAKLLTAFLVTIMVNLYFSGFYLAVQFFLLRISSADLYQPLFLVDGYGLCASGMSILSFLELQWGFALLVSLLTVFLTMVLSKKLGKSIFALISAFAVFLLGAILDLLNLGIYQNSLLSDTDNWYVASAVTFQKVFAYEKMLNPFSLIQASYYLEQPRFVRLGSENYPLAYLPVIIAIILVMVSSIYLVQNQRKAG